MGFLYERRSRRSRLRSQRLVFFLLRLFWVAFVIWHDFGAFVYSLAGCKWPDKALESWSSSATRPTRVMLIADVQVPNPATTRNLWFGEDPVTTYLRKSWSAVSRLRPDVVIFLGDVLSSGRYVRSKQEYDAYYDRFKSIFQHGNGTSFYFIPGNTDVGLGRSSSFTEDAPRFFTEYFGPLNQLVTIAGHKFVMIDASKLVEEDYHRHAHDKTYEQWTPLNGGPIAFITSIASTVAEDSVVLLSHIPLSRSAGQSCGSLREKGSIRAGAGHGYQNMLGKQTTEFILKMLGPIAVYSGDNRDYCEVTHQLPTSDGTGVGLKAREVTVKSFSPSRHIRWPGFQLISLIPPSPDLSGSIIADTACHLPDTQVIYKPLYFPCLVVTAAILLLVRIVSSQRHRISSFSRTRSTGPKSAIWSTWSPRLPERLASPTNPLPPNMRLASTRVPSYRVSPLSGTPRSSPPLSPITLFPTEGEMDDPLSPAHCIRERHDTRDGAWMAEHADEDEWTSDATTFLPPPSSQNTRTRLWSWTGSFEFAGRRRRITFGIPCWMICNENLISRSSSCLSRRRGPVWRFAYDALSIAFPALIIQVIVKWMFLTN